MIRRDFLILSAAAAALPMAAQAAFIGYTPELLADRLAKGETVFIDFSATWCSTCAAQERVISALKAENPAYAQQITFIKADWDTWGKSEIVRTMKIPRRSTLVVLKGDTELGRIVASTARADIKALMDTALQAAA